MKIFIDKVGDIKDINTTSDLNLTELELDREIYFNGLSDFEILNFNVSFDDESVIIIPKYKSEIIFKLKEANEKSEMLENCILELANIIGGNNNG